MVQEVLTRIKLWYLEALTDITRAQAQVAQQVEVIKADIMSRTSTHIHQHQLIVVPITITLVVVRWLSEVRALPVIHQRLHRYRILMV